MKVEVKIYDKKTRTIKNEIKSNVCRVIFNGPWIQVIFSNGNQITYSAIEVFCVIEEPEPVTGPDPRD